MSSPEKTTKLNALILYIRAITPIHVGVGKGRFVDQEIQRDEYGFPIIWGSSLKGALKSYLRKRIMESTSNNNNAHNLLERLLGGDPGEEKPSSISVLDARLLLMPARSLTNVWTYVTSPHLLRRVAEYISLGRNGEVYDKILKYEALSRLDSNRACVAVDNNIESAVNELGKDKKIYVNEYFEFSQVSCVNESLSKDMDILNLLMLKIENLKDLKELVARRGLLVVSDKNNLSKQVINRSIIINYRIALDRERKTVRKGSLWSEEYVPSDTVFVSALVSQSADDLGSLNKILGSGSFYLVLGGKEFLGKGIVKINVV